MALRIISVAVAFLAACIGLIAAWYWLRASQIPIKSCWNTGDGELGEEHHDWIVNTITAMNQSAGLNKKAALWTAVSVALGAIATVTALWD